MYFDRKWLIEIPRRSAPAWHYCTWFRPQPARPWITFTLTSGSLPMTSMVLPYELWYDILREATFIPREFDVSATTFRHGVLSGSDEHHLREYWKMLPTRAAIVKVCRVWHHIGTEFLYGSVHFMSWSDTDGTMWGNMALFRKLLESRPEIGTLVNRLSLPYHPTDQAAAEVLRMCPRITIFSTSSMGASCSWWAPTLFQPVLRQLDIMIDSQSWLKFVSVLNSIIYLEVLYMHVEGLFPPFPSNATSISLPALRLLELSFQSPYGASLDAFVLRFDVPRLRSLSLSTESPPLFQLLFPSQLQTITSLKVYHIYSLYMVDLQNLTQLYLTINRPTVLRYHSVFSPFHRLEQLGLNLLKPPWFWEDWTSHCEHLLELPLDPSAMPKLQILEISWGARRIVDWDSTATDRSDFVAYFQPMTTLFEQRGVELIEPQLDLLHNPMSIQSIVDIFRQRQAKSGRGSFSIS